MTAEQTTSELTTRDVLLQVDRRLTLIEDDLRKLDDKVDTKIDALDAKFDTKIDALDAKFTTKFDTGFNALDTKIDTKIDGLRREMNTRFYWLIGLFFVGWVSMIGTILFKS